MQRGNGADRTGRGRTAWFARLVTFGTAVSLLGQPVLANPPLSVVKKPAAAVKLAEFVPVPRLKPARKLADPIAELIDDGGDDPSAPVAADQVDGPAADVALPPPRPDTPPAGGQLAGVGLRLAVKLLDDGDPVAATVAAYALPDRVDTKIVNWLVGISGAPQVTSARILDIAKQLPNWPGQILLRQRFEEALIREKPGAADIVKAFAGAKPVTDDGLVLLARALVSTGRAADAAALVRPAWRDGNLSDDVEASIRREFGGMLTAADNKARLGRLLYKGRTDQALKVAALLDKNQQALAAAVVKAIKRQPKAAAGLDALPPAVRNDPIVLYSRIQLLRRDEKYDAAAKLMLSAPRDAALLVDPDAWWVERRLIARELLDEGDARTAYRIAAGHAAESSALRAEAEFHAGWIALEFLKDPTTARRHFLAIQAISTMPLSLSRAEYWLGRAAAAAGDRNEAAAQYRRAGAYPTTFYGQLALAELGVKRLALSAPPAADPALRQSFDQREFVQVIKRLVAINRDDRVGLFYRALADTLTDPREIALLSQLAEGYGEHQIALQIGKMATSRGLPVEALAFPTAAIPPDAKTSAVEKPMVYAIARQESAFNPGAISRAGARGLLQLMPATAKQTAKNAGLPFSQARLTTDPAYNATLGAVHLGELFDEFGGSYVMTFASYNAGKRRVYDWVKAHGDPRDPKVDVVNWIEMIPFTETRNYVQRIMENLQVYRARLGDGGLTIGTDLKHGTIN
jgi:soluble lytic murein transglycosylase